MSYLDFTGFFFPLTGEANVNMASPVFLLPSTTQHEIAHQRGVAAEQECNFVAIFSCLNSQYADFRYAGAALGYIYLGNALSRADREAWEEVYYSLSETSGATFRRTTPIGTSLRTAPCSPPPTASTTPSSNPTARNWAARATASA